MKVTKIQEIQSGLITKRILSIRPSKASKVRSLIIGLSSIVLVNVPNLIKDSRNVKLAYVYSNHLKAGWNAFMFDG